MKSDSNSDKLQQSRVESIHNTEENEDIDMKMIERVRLATRIRNLESYQTTNTPSTFNGYLNLWCVNPSLQVLAAVDDSITKSKIQEISTSYKISACFSFALMTTFYKLANGFECTWPKYARYTRHIVCISAGTFILPKYILYVQVSQIYDFLKYQQDKYESTLLWKENVESAEKYLKQYQSKEFFEEKLKKAAINAKRIKQDEQNQFINTGEINEKDK